MCMSYRTRAPERAPAKDEECRGELRKKGETRRWPDGPRTLLRSLPRCARRSCATPGQRHTLLLLLLRLPQQCAYTCEALVGEAGEACLTTCCAV